MEAKYSFYALFKDGSYTPLDSISSISKLPHFDFIVRQKVYDLHSTKYSEFSFINAKADSKPLKIGDWEVIHIEREDILLKLKPDQKYKMTYKLYNHTTKTVFDFARYVRGMKFFKEELFPKLAELSNSPDLIILTMSNALNNIRDELLEIKNSLLDLSQKIPQDNSSKPQ